MTLPVSDEGAPLPHDLSVSGKVLDGALTLSVGYSSERYRTSTVEGLMDAVRVELERVIEHCTSGNTGVTPSDFELISLTQNELDRLPLTLKNVADIYPLSPMQTGMLFHTLYAPRSSVYLNQLRADIDGLRAFAVLAVIAFHVDFKGTPGGFVGVDIFAQQIVFGVVLVLAVVVTIDRSKIPVVK